MSLQHQVLCDQTALVGVIKQKDSATGEIQEHMVQVDKFTSVQQNQTENEDYLQYDLSKAFQKPKKEKSSSEGFFTGLSFGRTMKMGSKGSSRR